MDNAIALLVVTCPCALALATPLAVTAATGRAARRGIFVKGGDALEQLATPATLLLDKTGTITEGALSLVRFDGPEWVKPLIAALEAGNTHPIATAFTGGLGVNATPRVQTSRHVPGSGVVGRVDGREVAIGKPEFVEAVVGSSRAAISESRTPGHATLTRILAAVDGEIVAQAWFGDAVRDDARTSIRTLQHAGWDVGILSGDAQSVVDDVARTVGIEASRARGDASPESKLEAVEAARRRGRVVMVGDGVNDAVAIAAASVGIGVHGGAEASLSVADVYLTRPGLGEIVELVDGARRTMVIIRRGIWFSIAYNLLGVTLAVLGVINPLVAAVMMPASSLTVLYGAWRGRSFGTEAA